jgi:hypothetical protein
MPNEQPTVDKNQQCKSYTTASISNTAGLSKAAMTAMHVGRGGDHDQWVQGRKGLLRQLLQGKPSQL